MNAWSSLVKHTTLFFLVLAVGLALVLFSVKYQVQDLEEELSELKTRIAAEQRATHVLRAEWSYLTEPVRLRRLADRYLHLAPLTPSQLGTFAALPKSPGHVAEHAATLAAIDEAVRLHIPAGGAPRR